MEWRKRLVLIVIGFTLMFPWTLRRGLLPHDDVGSRGPASIGLPAHQALCRESHTPEPPFLVAAAGRTGLNYSYFASQARASAVVGYLPRSSIVKLAPGARLPDSDVLARKHVFVPVQVLSTPSDGLDLTGQKSRQPIKTVIVGHGDRIEAGSEGYISADTLRPASDYTFIVKEDSPLARIPGAGSYLAGRALRLAIDSSGLYKVRNCCLPGPGPETGRCQVHYLFEVLKPDLSGVERDFAFDRDACASELSGLRPVDNEQIAPMLSFVNMTQSSMGRGIASVELIDSLGFVKIPSDSETGEGPFGSYHYDPLGGTAVAYDSFANATSACVFLKVLEEQQQICTRPGCQIQWGQAFIPREWGKHKEHQSGQCIDLHPLKRVDSHDPLKWDYDPKHLYDRRKTQELVDLLLRAGADPNHLFFNDPSIHGTHHEEGHDNHIHVCFRPEDPVVQSSCQNGIPAAPQVPLAKQELPNRAQRKPSGLTRPRKP